MTEITFVVPGLAAPAGSKRGFPTKTGGVRIVDDNPNNKPWQAAVATAGALAMTGRELMAGPVGLDVTVFRPYRKSDMRPDGTLRANARRFPATRPDLLKLARSIEDALTGIVWIDDAQIVIEHLQKNYSLAGARAIIRAWEITDTSVADAAVRAA